MLIRYFAAAEAAAGRSSEHLEAPDIATLKAELARRHGEGFAAVLSRCSLLVDGKAGLPEDHLLDGVTGVDILPPFAGG